MTVIVGLGNPGRQYRNTRHNLGFMVIDHLAKLYELDFIKEQDYHISYGQIEGHRVILLKPMTFMNLSGVAVRKIFDHEIAERLPNSLIVIHDDLDLPLGRIKIKRDGSSGGHRGVNSIIENLKTKDFIRVKVGIGKKAGVDVSEYVLSPFTEQEKPLIRERISRAAQAVVSILCEGLERAMNRYNREEIECTC